MGTTMPNHLAEIYTNNTDLAILAGIAILVLAGVFLVLRHALVAVLRSRPKPNAYLKECKPVPLEEVPWVWERPVDLATGPGSSQAVVSSDADARPQDANYRQFGVRIEHFEMISEAYESSPGDLPNPFASPTNSATDSPPRVGWPIGLVSGLGIATICLAVSLGYTMTRQNWVESAPAISQAQNPSQPNFSRSFTVPASAALDMEGPAQGDGRTNAASPGPDLAAAKAEVEAARAQASAARNLAGQEHRAVEEERARSASLQSALLESRKQVDALRTSMAAADDAYGERLRNELTAARTYDALQRIAGDARRLLGESINYVVTQMPADHLERQRTELMARDLSQARAQISQLQATAAADRASAKASLAQVNALLDDERRKSMDLRGDLAAMELSKAAIADKAERERTGAATAGGRVEQTATETAQTLARERASAASTREDLDKARLERDAAEQERAKAVKAKEHAEQTAAETAQALTRARASAASTREDLDKARLERDAAEQERAKAVKAKERAEQTAAETAQALALARASAASTNEDLDKARLERDAAEQERVRAVSARQRAEQSAAETAQALTRERASAASAREDLNKARLERGTSPALSGEVTRLNEALDNQREATVSLARDLAAKRADNDKLRAERRSAQIEQPLQPRSGRASAGTGQMKAVSQKTTTRSKLRNSSQVIRVRTIALPFALRPIHPTSD
ncbi:hypothetical protein [Mesorhizobium sp. CA16]|uniref:hypothetical protein n=1 Tax=Mesorhizobium sp. CA16 TaxID=588496 RepID=UPI001CCA527C|nr:hypothetical protein [Mesorhizobium sp. CA16]MBZ9914675.1 hypothetical protein [Mesorhizobium sp. CA16]